MTVRGARGYSISEALFGTYGRVGIWPCKSPFDQYASVSGDLAECDESRLSARAAKAARPRALTATEKLDWHYINGVLQIYEEATPTIKSRSVTAAEATAFHLKLFMYMAEFNLGPMLGKRLAKRLKQLRNATERKRLKLEQPFAKGEARSEEFVAAFNQVTLDFQDEMADAMTPEQYVTMFDLRPDERVVLADQKIVARAFKGI
jgi:hypothetical protein